MIEDTCVRDKRYMREKKTLRVSLKKSERSMTGKKTTMTNARRFSAKTEGDRYGKPVTVFVATT